MAVRPYSAARSLSFALSPGACVSSSATRSSAITRSRWASADRPIDWDGSMTVASFDHRSSGPSSASSVSPGPLRRAWRAVSAWRGLAAQYSRGPSNPKNRSFSSCSSLYARIQRTSSRLAGDVPNLWLKPCSMTSSSVPSPVAMWSSTTRPMRQSLSMANDR